MGWRERLPRSIRSYRVGLLINQAELQESLARTCSTTKDRDRHARAAIQLYALALKWRPLQHPGELPGPGDMQSPAHEQMEQVETDETIPCIICGKLIPVRRKGSTYTGKYCDEHGHLEQL